MHLVKHENCCAYANLLRAEVIGHDPDTERSLQLKASDLFAKHIRDTYCYEDRSTTYSMNIHTLRMNLRGHAELLKTYPGRKKNPKK